MATPSKFDIDVFPLARERMDSFVVQMAKRLSGEKGKLLEIGPQERSLVRESFVNYTIHTFDIVDTYKPNFVGDITRKNEFIPDGSYDCVVCMDVIEHTVQPFETIKELRRILRHDGLLLIGAPLNIRIHGPIPDCWRFTEHGWKVLLKDFNIEVFDILESPERELFPLRYDILARCDKNKNTPIGDLKFRYI